MKKLMFLSVALLLSLYSCNSKKDAKSEKFSLEASLIDTIKPKTNYSVHKEYDKYGNLISVDSTYSYIYSNGNLPDKMQEKIFEQFKSELSTKFPGLHNDFFNNFFGDENINDSVFKDNFYSPNYFFKNQNKQITRMLKRMDSIKNSFYKEQLKVLKKQV